jgi:hypothetical protein
MTHPIENLILQEISKALLAEQEAPPSRIKMKSSEIKKIVVKTVQDRMHDIAKLEAEKKFDIFGKDSVHQGESVIQKYFEKAGIPKGGRAMRYATAQFKKLRKKDSYRKLVQRYGAGDPAAYDVGVDAIKKIQLTFREGKSLEVNIYMENPNFEKENIPGRFANSYKNWYFGRQEGSGDLIDLLCAILKDIKEKKQISPRELVNTEISTFFYNPPHTSRAGIYFRTFGSFIDEKATAARPCLDGKPRESLPEPAPAAAAPVKTTSDAVAAKVTTTGGGRRRLRCYYPQTRDGCTKVSKKAMFALLKKDYGLTSEVCNAAARKAIKELQRDVGATPDGAFGPNTANAAIAKNKLTADRNCASSGGGGNKVEKIIERGDKACFHPEPSGVFDEKRCKACKRYWQELNSLKKTGVGQGSIGPFIEEKKQAVKDFIDKHYDGTTCKPKPKAPASNQGSN